MDVDPLLLIEIILLIVGVAGCIVPGLPGIPLAYLAILIQHFNKAQPNYPVWVLLLLGVLVLIIIALQYIIPAWSTKKFGASKFAVWGSIIGLIVGIFASGIIPFGFLLLPFVGAVAGELFFAKKSMDESLKAGLGAFIGILASSVVELIFTLGIVAIFIISLV